jgi:type IV secretory pathway VirB10-like protein
MEQERRKKEEEEKQKEIEYQKRLEARKRYRKRNHALPLAMPKQTPSPTVPPKKPTVNSKEILENQKRREEKYFARILEHRRKAENDEQEKHHRLEKLKQKVKVVVERDPSRLLQPTQGILRKITSIEKDSSTRGLVTFQKRMVPEWRIGCN